MNRRDLLLLGGSGLLLSALPASARADGPGVLQGPAFGSSWRLVADLSAVDAAALAAGIEAVIASVDGGMSPFRADSEISRFNRSGDTDWQALSPETCAVVTEALRVASMTGGTFNPTVGPLVGKYGFGPIHVGLVGRSTEIEVRDGAVKKRRAGLSLDLCGIAKGHALDRLARTCMAHGVADCLIELGGEVFATGRHPSGRAWQVGVEGPHGLRHAVALEGMSLATSGVAVNAYAHRGRRYAHIVDPATGRPVDSALFSVTVASRRAATADALATALFVMGPERGADFADKAGIEALFVRRDGGDTATGGFDARILG